MPKKAEGRPPMGRPPKIAHRRSQSNTPPRPGQTEYPAPTTAQERYIRDHRNLLEEYGALTGDRRALAAAECLTFVLIEGGCRP
jgi:hypothetical protein